EVIRAEAGPLEIGPIDRQFPPAAVDPGARFPEDRVFPGRNCRDAPGAEGAPVVGEVAGEDRIPLGKDLRAEGIGIIPAVPEAAGPELLGLPPEFLLLHRANAVGPIAEELRVPLRQAEFPGHSSAAELALAAVPAPVHGAVPGERHAVFAEEERLHTLS